MRKVRHLAEVRSRRRSWSRWVSGVVLGSCSACGPAQSERPAKSVTNLEQEGAVADSAPEDSNDTAVDACRDESCAGASDWGPRRDDILASYRHVVPASQEEVEEAEKRSLMAPEGAPPDPELEWIFDEKRASGERLREWCRQQVGFPEERPFESCGLESLTDGAALLLTFVLECGGDSCSTESYVRSPVVEGFVLVPHDLGGGAAASAGGDALFVSSITPVALPGSEVEQARDPWGGEEALILDRIALPSMERKSFAPCFSPTLSPKGRWIVCRDLAGNVLKVSPRGGKPVVVEKSGLKKGEVYFVWYAYIWPDPVEFLSDERLKFRVVRADGESFEREISWQE